MHLQIIVLIVSMVMYTLTLMVGHLIQKKEMHRREARLEYQMKRAVWLKPVDFLSFALNTLSIVGVLYGAREETDSWSVLIAAILVGYSIHTFSPPHFGEGGGGENDPEGARMRGEDEGLHPLPLMTLLSDKR
jgi:hypothetical protein